MRRIIDESRLAAMGATSKAALFCSGVFFGGAVDHTILALKRAEQTPYGLKSGVAGNWMLAALDALATAGFYMLSRRGNGRGCL